MPVGLEASISRASASESVSDQKFSSELNPNETWTWHIKVELDTWKLNLTHETRNLTYGTVLPGQEFGAPNVLFLMV